MPSRGRSRRRSLTIDRSTGAVLAVGVIVAAFSIYVILRIPTGAERVDASSDAGRFHQILREGREARAAQEPALVAVIGDSYTAVANNKNPWPQTLQDRYGVTFENFAVGGTGYLRTSAEGGPWRKMLDAAIQDRPDAIVFAGSRNDDPFPPTQVEREARSLYRLAEKRLPGVKIYVVGPMWDATQAPAADVAIDRAVRRAVGDRPFADGLTWLQGRPDLIGPDGIHPNDKGEALIARRVAGFLQRNGLLAAG